MRKILFAALVLGASPAWAQDSGEFRPGGLRIEAHAGIERPSLSDTQNGTTYVDKLGSSFVYGGEIGYDIPVSAKVTVGPYVSLDSGGSNKCETYVPGASQQGTACFHSKSDLSVGGRVGFVLSPKTELYLGVGYDSNSVEFSDIVTNTTTSTVVSTYTNNKARSGVGISMGANFSMSRNLYVGVGARISELGEFEGTGFKLQRVQAHGAIGLRF